MKIITKATIRVLRQLAAFDSRVFVYTRSTTNCQHSSKLCSTGSVNQLWLWQQVGILPNIKDAIADAKLKQTATATPPADT